ncbi:MULTISPECIES: spirocyclase AveC family protein [Streptomyces]|uniref:spirocyclase AveC family protein n=1 Tax=Streptomyces TaxID=1883 RepID=UPI0004CCB43A|nr:spirocyclase AveC family protein [Streptomyces durhamensis]
MIAGGLILWICAVLGIATELSAMRPGWDWPRFGLALLPPVMVLDAVAETLLIRTGAYADVGAPPRYSLFGGHWYQIPLAQLVLCPSSSSCPRCCPPCCSS